MPATDTVRIFLPDERDYEIRIGSGLLNEPASWQGLPQATAAVIVSNDKVAPLYAERLSERLQAVYARVDLVVLPDGERHKDWASLNRICDHLLAEALDRKTVLFALGGGVIGDMTGFAAAIYMRGVPFVQVPTTLLAQVDSSVGGKTAINHPLGKNMLGAFYQPERVIADLDTLDSLPDRELRSGLAEVIKYGPIADAAFLCWIEDNLDALLAREKAVLGYAVRRSCEIKADVVGQDEREQGLRAILNFGHTIGHAIEAGLGYGEWLHGEAVGLGLCMAADTSMRLGWLSATDAARVTALVARAGLPTRPPAAMGVDDFRRLMARDKKVAAGRVRLVLLRAIGEATLTADFDPGALDATLARFCAASAAA